MLFNALVAIACLVGWTDGVDITMVNTWSGGFEGKFRIQAINDLQGWTAHLLFNMPVDSITIWSAMVTSVNDGGLDYVLGPMEWNSNLQSGAYLEMNFLAVVDGDGGAVSGTAFIEGNSAGGSIETTTAATTTATTTTATTTTAATTMAATTTAATAGGNAKYNLTDVLRKSILFYEAQRSGDLPDNNRVTWRGDSAMGDGGVGGEDLTGGWYDAGDFVKFGFPMAASTTLLAWGLIQWPDAYIAAGELDNMYDLIKWPLDYFIKCHVSLNELYFQVGDGDADHAYWGRPEDMTMSRPAFKLDVSTPGSDVAGETAAALAAGSIAFQTRDADYSATLLTHARQVYSFAVANKGIYTDSSSAARDFYKSTNYWDELTWAAAWLYKATGEGQFLTDAENHYVSGNVGATAWALSWDDKKVGAQLLLFEATASDTYRNDIESFMTSWMPGGGLTYTPQGLAYRDQWGPLRYAANTAFVALMAADMGLHQTAYREWAEGQLYYMLGDTGNSYVVGFGINPPQSPHHRSSSCPDQPASCDWDEFNSIAPNPQVLYGALVGGPDNQDYYVDVRSDYVKNEVACDYNAGFQSAIAGLKHLY